MADVVGSRGYSQLELYEKLKSLVEFANSSFSKKLLSPLTVTLGDEFQGVVVSLKDASELLFFMEEYLATNNFGFKLRFVICYGNIDTPINKLNAMGMLGAGLTNARKLLNDSKKSKIRFQILLEDSIKTEILSNCFIIYQELIEKWYNRKDIDHIALINKEMDYKVVSAKLNISRSQIWKKYNTLNFKSLFAIKRIVFLNS
jgi:hypothetical protein